MSRTCFAYMMASTLCYTLVDALVKYMRHFSPAQLGFWNSVTSLVLVGLFILWYDIRPRGHNQGLLLLRGLSGLVVMILVYATTQRTSLAIATTLKLLSGVLAPLVGIWMVGEKVAPPQWACMGLSFLGVYYIHHSDGQLPAVAMVTGLLAAWSIAFSLNVMKKLSSREHPLLITLYMPLVAMPSLGCYLWWQQQLGSLIPQATDWAILLLMGLAMVLGRYCHTKAFAHGSVTDTSLMLYLMVVYSSLIDHVVFHEALQPNTLWGIMLIFTGLIGNLLYKRQRLQYS